jgi:hypothetical protein
VSTALLVYGYPAAVAVIARWVPVVRERRWGWLAVHHSGVAAIVTGWALKGNTRSVIVNSSWLVASSVWFALGGRRQAGNGRL